MSEAHLLRPLLSFDFQSINLALNQEWIELDLFRYALRRFSPSEFREAGLNVSDRVLVNFMADQEVSHATVLSNILGPRAAKPCQYEYPFNTVRGFIDFAQKLTRWGESGVYGFLSFLENPNSAQLLLESIATEARQQQIYRQFEGLFPVTVYHVVGIPQSWAWTLLHPYLKSCPKSNPFVEFDIYPSLRILNNPNPYAINPQPPSIAPIRNTSLSQPGRRVFFRFDRPGRRVNPDGDYQTVSRSRSRFPRYAAWASQYNVTYSELRNVNSTSAWTIQPNSTLFPNQVNYPSINGTMFIVLTDTNLPVTPSNITLLNDHIIAGPAVYQVD
ncbi:protein rds1 [Phakopsora pachyrhizi]|uniref:Protein rds1 n=1 Tax=Phakopsora pachyrhizi TaxID=170000 RepID=A0AAV0AQ03_PHAPC|nr:protein rds1 [Phakopsora pachyrhizi]